MPSSIILTSLEYRGGLRQIYKILRIDKASYAARSLYLKLGKQFSLIRATSSRLPPVLKPVLVFMKSAPDSGNAAENFSRSR